MSHCLSTPWQFLPHYILWIAFVNTKQPRQKSSHSRPTPILIYLSYLMLISGISAYPSFSLFIAASLSDFNNSSLICCSHLVVPLKVPLGNETLIMSLQSLQPCMALFRFQIKNQCPHLAPQVVTRTIFCLPLCIPCHESPLTM